MKRNKISAPLRSLLIGIAVSIVSVSAYAGGLTAGTSAITNFETWFFSICGILAICYLLWVGVQCWSNKADWVHDFGGAIAKVAAVGSVPVLAAWAWAVFGS
jgi:threonine/homoserine/homoserine lactone efflux protein